MSMRVTFDTNAIDRAVRPEILPQTLQHTDYLKIQQALTSGKIEGFFSETIVTLEGVQNVDRVDVFGGTQIIKKLPDPSGPQQTEALVLEVSQPLRKPLHPLAQERVKAALQIGMRALRTPRIGAMLINDPDRKFFFYDDPAGQSTRLDRTYELGREISGRGAGFAHIEAVSRRLAARDGVTEPWFKSLLRAKDEHEKKEVNKAVAEWADGDGVAAHSGYGLDLFCTEDKAANAGAASVMSPANRAWLKTQYGVTFVTLFELAAIL